MTALPARAQARSGVMKLPTKEELDKAAADFDRDWGAVDEILYGICREHPGHRELRQVTAKIALIDRTYSAGFERRVTPPPGQQAITVIANFVLAHAAQIDAIIGRLASVQEPLTADAMAEIVAEHGRLVALLREVATDGKAPRSFAAKYLHFHCPIVPIYDSYAVARLVKLVPWREIAEPFAQSQNADAEYWSFSVRFWHLYEACHKGGLAATVKGLDTYLWAVPGAT